MKAFEERNPYIIGAIGVTITVVLVTFGLTFDKLPFLSAGKTYSAYFADAGALKSGTDVQVSGALVGKVSAIKLEGAKVRIDFTVDDGIALGDRSEAAIKTDTLLGTKVLQVTPRGEGPLDGSIPLERTTSPYTLTDALGELSDTVEGLETDRLSDSLATLTETFKDTPPDLKIAVDGVARFSRSLNNRDQQLRSLLANANKATTVLGQRTDQIVALIHDTNALLAELQTESGSLDGIAGNLSVLSQQISGFVAENQDLRPTLDRLNGVLAIVDNRKVQVQEAVKLLNAYAMSLGEAVASGPFFNAYVANLLPGQFVQPFVDAAFSDLGLDPNVLLPSERVDPPVGQPGTPALPIPFPRTGQGGEPRMTLPDAITGNQDPSLPQQFPGRYPYREPLPAPPPGGPPPGPPAPTPSPVYVPAPNEVPPADQSGAP